MTVDITAVDVPLPQVESAAILLAALQATHSPSDALAYRLDMRLVTQPDALTVEARPDWDHYIARLVELNELHRQAAEFNAANPVGTPVTAYPGARPEDHPGDEQLVTRTRSRASVLGGHTAVVWVEGHSACIALSHIDPRTGGTS